MKRLFSEVFDWLLIITLASITVFSIVGVIFNIKII